MAKDSDSPDTPTPPTKPSQRVEVAHAGDFHESKGEVREAIDKAKDFWAKFGNYILIVLVVIFGSIAIYRLVNYLEVSKLNNASDALVAAGTSAEANEAVAAEHDGAEGIASLAKLRAADLYLQRSRQAEAADLTAEDKAAALTKAGELYQRVATESEAAVFQINGHLGVANVAEQQGQWDQAKQAWQTASKLADEHHYTALKAKADERLALVDQISQPIPFGEPRPPEPPATQPEPIATQPAATATSPATQGTE